MKRRNRKLFVALLIILLGVGFPGYLKAEETPKGARKRLEHREIRKAGRGEEKKAFLGMTREQVIESWGNPRNIDKNLSSTGNAHEKWYYGDTSKENDQCLHFDNGVVTSWEE